MLPCFSAFGLPVSILEVFWFPIWCRRAFGFVIVALGKVGTTVTKNANMSRDMTLTSFDAEYLGYLCKATLLGGSTHKTICSWNPKRPTISYVKIWNHPIDSQSFLNGWLFGVPGVFVFFFGWGPFLGKASLYAAVGFECLCHLFLCHLGHAHRRRVFLGGFFFVQKLGSQGDCWWTKSCTRWYAQESQGWPNELPRLVDSGNPEWNGIIEKKASHDLFGRLDETRVW